MSICACVGSFNVAFQPHEVPNAYVRRTTNISDNRQGLSVDGAADRSSATEIGHQSSDDEADHPVQVRLQKVINPCMKLIQFLS